MSEENKTGMEVAEQQVADGGRIIFADDVVATIAALATAEIPGVAAMSGGAIEGFTEKLGGKKNLTKGVKVEVGAEEAAVDLSVNIMFGYRIREVCEQIQNAVKNSIETMTGLRVVEVNVFVQAVTFEPTEPTRAEKKAEKEKEKQLLKEQAAKEKAEKEKEKQLLKEQAEKEEAEKAAAQAPAEPAARVK